MVYWVCLPGSGKASMILLAKAHLLSPAVWLFRGKFFDYISDAPFVMRCRHADMLANTIFEQTHVVCNEREMRYSGFLKSLLQ